MGDVIVDRLAVLTGRLDVVLVLAIKRLLAEHVARLLLVHVLGSRPPAVPRAHAHGEPSTKQDDDGDHDDQHPLARRDVAGRVGAGQRRRAACWGATRRRDNRLRITRIRLRGEAAWLCVAAHEAHERRARGAAVDLSPDNVTHLLHTPTVSATGLLGALLNSSPWRDQAVGGEVHPDVAAVLDVRLEEVALLEAAVVCLDLFVEGLKHLLWRRGGLRIAVGLQVGRAHCHIGDVGAALTPNTSCRHTVHTHSGALGQHVSEL
mmetsp:Transcript_46710/g.116392  ORF Transcript_46710/g.116392 Transcript_46710/m.116392 type:complete len:263 (-) Transcript_46710:1394-2182(-)